MKKFVNLFKRSSGVVIGMCHLQALPGSPMSKLPLPKIIDLVLKEADIYVNANVDSVMIENMHDIPYVKSSDMGPEVVASMATVACKVRQHFPHIPLGLQVLTAGNKEAVAIAKCAEFDFVRCEGFAFSHVGDEGWIDACAGPLLRYRKAIDAENVLIFTDAKKKHSSHSVTRDMTVAETAKALQFFLSDGIIVTGTETGSATDESDLRNVLSSVDLPVLVGSGVTSDNIAKYMNASALIVGSYFKKGGFWMNEVDPTRVELFMQNINDLRK